MTTIDPAPAIAPPTELVPVLPDTAWDRFESLLMRASDRLNPILVKEARQALRSRQFIFTFFLMLAAGWIWSIAGFGIHRSGRVLLGRRPADAVRATT